jgi:hypothetical protein
MSADYDQRLETEIERELKALPELNAPSTLAPRVMEAILRRAGVAWYRQSWQLWPAPLRSLSLTATVLLVGAVCLGLWLLPQTQPFSALMHKCAAWASGPAAIWNALNSLAGTGVLLVKRLGTPFLVGCLLAFGLAWAACLGLGTACVRLALAKR